jgi:tRNA-binding protein
VIQVILTNCRIEIFDFQMIIGSCNPKRLVNDMTQQITFDDFLKVDIRVGTILSVEPFEKARKPAYQLQVDFGPEIGIKRSSAQITALYDADALVGRQVLAVVNFPVRQIANFFSEVLVLGLTQEDGAVALVVPERALPNGLRLS